jgi:IPT/TIG domain
MIRINDRKCKSTLKAAAVVSVLFLCAAVAAFGQAQQINLTAAPTTTQLPDGTIVPMWGYFCGTAVNGSTATCAALNPNSITTTSGTTTSTWSPVVITIPAGTPTSPASLTINLTNSLSFTPTGSTTANTVPTSIVIIGQVGGGLGGIPTTTPSPSHANAQGCPTWFIANPGVPGAPCTGPVANASGTPPNQGPRVQSMATEVAVGTTPVALNWPALKPGTYLLESGTHPSIQVPMGLIGVLVVTTAPTGTGTATPVAGTAYPGAAATTTTGAIPAVQYNAEIPMVFSEIDPVQNNEVATAVATAGFSETNVWSGMVGQCGNPSSPVGVVHTCYPPAVNYTPFYYLINGVAFNKTAPGVSAFGATAGTSTSTTTPPVTSPVLTGITGTVLVRLVNAGLRLHVPSIVGALTNGFPGTASATPQGTTTGVVQGFTLIAEDGNVLPNVAPPGWMGAVPASPRVQTDVLMVPGKVYDALINVPATPSTGAVPDLPIYDRELSLSGNSSVRDAGMLAYISVNNSTPSSGLPVMAGTGVFAAAVARDDAYASLIAGQPFTVSDPSKGLLANDTNVYGATLLTLPTNGTLTCPAAPLGIPNAGICSNGTFTWTPNTGSTATMDTFTYCANGSVTAGVCSSSKSATVKLTAATLEGAAGITCNFPTPAFTSNIATFLKIASPGVLSYCHDAAGYPLSVVLGTTTTSGQTASAPTISAGTVLMDANGGFNASVPASTTSATLNFYIQNSQGTPSAQTLTVNFPTASGLVVNVLDAQLYNNCLANSSGSAACISGITPISDYRWIIEEDKTFWVDPNCTTNASATTAGCPSIAGPSGTSTVPSFGVNFHTSTMDYVAQGCTGPLSCEYGQTFLNPATGTHDNAVCDVGNGACRPDTGNGTSSGGFTWVNPNQVHLDPAKRYYISVLPGDAGNPFPAYVNQPVCSSTGGTSTTGTCGHTMSGAPIPPACNVLGGPNACTASSAFAPVNVIALPTPLPTGRLSVIVFEDDFPLNGEQDGGGGNGTVAPIEPGLGGFNIVLWDTFGGLGDVTGQDTYDMFNQPLSNGLAGTIDPSTGLDACPVSATPLTATPGAGSSTGPSNPASGITGMIVTCPKFESDNTTLSPLAGQAVIYNLMPEKFSVQAYPGADRIARGEQWLQTNTLDGQHPHDSFIRIGEPSYFQEYGPAGYHVSIGFANPAIINARAKDVCAGAGTPGAVGSCTNTITGQVDVQRISRTPDQRLYPSGTRDALAWTQCWVSLGDPDGEDFMFAMCDSQGNFKFSNVPGGEWRLTIGDQWNDQIIDGLSTPVNVGVSGAGVTELACPGSGSSTGNGSTCNLGNIGVQQWQSNLYTRTYVDDNKDGIWETNEIGIPFLYTRIYYRDGHNSNGLNTDFNGIANFNETYPLFNWYVVEADSTRYKRTGIHSVYDAGGPADGTCATGTRPCGTSTGYLNMSNTYEALPLPADLSVPGAVYCTKADCMTEAAGFAAGTAKPSSATASTGRIDPPWVSAEGWAGLTGLSNWIDFGFAPYAPTENGGIHGQVTYASTRPFDDASQMILQPWEPLVPGVTINLYQEGLAADGVTPTLTLVDTTKTTSWDAWAQGFYPNSTATPGTGQTAAQKPYMSCPGQGVAPVASGTQPANADLFYFTLFDQPNFLDYYNSIHNGGTLHTLPYNSQYKCYDSMHQANQIQPAVYDGEFFFPSSLGVDPTTGKPITPTGYINPITGAAPTMTGTNCTICTLNPDTTDKYRGNIAPMLPAGKYVVQVVMPPGYEVYKEEDKNLLIGDNFIAPVTQQFGGLGTYIFIIPDQASVASMYDETGAGFNPTNYQNQTTGLGLSDELSGVPGYPGFQDPLWPCVGEQRVVPDYLSLFPQVHEVAPFAGATRPLCDRKEVTLANQMNVRMHFAIFTSTHIASKYAGGITDDFTSEFDPFSPQFGEKFAPPNLPVSTKDYLGNEISRVYSDHWGAYDGLTYSSWEVNPPNITGYSPTMMVQCMNDPGPIMDTRIQIACSGSSCGSSPQGTLIANPTYGQLITDPLYNPAYSNFCYENPYMPGLTTYLDTPVVPTQAFVGAAYNNVDCSYPDTMPAIKEVDSSNGIGPWVSAAGPGHTLTITALGDVQVNNNAYAGPSASVAPFNLKTVPRHYGFGTRCTAVSATCSKVSSVTIGGVNANISTWTDTQIVVTVPESVPSCPIQQQSQYTGSAAQCGQLVITAGNGRQSVDTVTVTIGGKAPTPVLPNQSVQAAIDAAMPGDMLMIYPTCFTVASGTTPSAPAACSASALDAATPTQTSAPAAHNELLIMWKPVRLQGVGAVSSVIDASAFPGGKLLDPWRRRINCLFGLNLSGVPTTPTNSAFDPNGTFTCGGWTGYVGAPNSPQIDRLPLEATVGWDATQNGNIAEQLQEPSLMGAFEGAAITVLGKGVDFHGADPWTDGNEGGAFPTGSTLLTGVVPNPAGAPNSAGAIQVGDNNPLCTDGTSGANRFPSNFVCNPSSIDGLTIRDSSQGGGGIFSHGWAHFLQIANNRVYNNAGTLTGGISVGQGEFPTPYLQGGTTNAAPGSCSDGTNFTTNQHLPYCLQLQVNVHNNYITNNSSLGDELFSGTLAGSGAVTFCTGNDYYAFNYNWVCGNLSSGEGGGLTHLGEIQNGDIEHNSIIFNQSTNPTIPTNGGGIQVMGTPDTDPTCGTRIDADCPPGLSDGTGHNLTINANLIQGNMAESGSGGGIRLQQVNGTDVSTFPSLPGLWNNVNITNNIIANNVAGWDGAGISLQDSLSVNIVNNTVVDNDTLASSGVLTTGIGAPDASSPNTTNPNCHSGALSCPQPSGIASTLNSSLLTTTFTGLTITCPPGHYAGGGANNGTCTHISYPAVYNDLVYGNRAFYISVGASGTGNQNQQNLVSLVYGSGATPAPNQTSTGQCSGGTIWDIGVRGDTGPGNHGSGYTLGAPNTMTTPAGGAATNVFVSSYCNGSRVPPECTAADGCGGPSGYGVPPGIADALTPNPRFSLSPSATVDEGNNWINVSWGPLTLSNPSIAGPDGNFGGGLALGNYSPGANSPAIDGIAPGEATPGATVPTTDFFGNPRPNPDGDGRVDYGAVEIQAGRCGTTGNPACPAPTLTSIAPTSGSRSTTVPVTLTGTNLTGTSAVTISGTGVTASGIGVVSSTEVVATFTITATAGTGTHNVSVTTPDGTSNTVAFTVFAAPTLTSINPTSGTEGTTVPVTLTGTNLTGATAVNILPTTAGITVGAITVNGAGTSLTTTFTIASTATVGTDTVSVTTPGGTTGTVNFRVTAPGAPTLTSISPTSGAQGASVPVSLNGTNLTGATAINIAPTTAGITVGAFTVNGAGTQITTTFTIAATAPTGTDTVSVTTPIGTSGTVNFAVRPPAPTLTSMSPNTGGAGTTVPVTLTGTNLTGASAVTMAGGGVTCTITGTSTATNVTASCVISATATTGARTVTVTTPGGTSNAVTFTITGATVTSIAPTTGSRGETVPVTITGTNLATASAVALLTGGGAAGGVTCTITGTSTATTVTANCAISTTATLSARNVTVTTTDGTAVLTGGFTVTAATVTFSAPSPALTTTPANTTTKSGTITVTNSGTAAVTLTASPTVNPTGTATLGFTITGGTCTSGATVNSGGGTCTIVVQYAPGTSTATASATVTIQVAPDAFTSASFNAN